MTHRVIRRRQPVIDAGGLGETLHPVLRRVYAARGVGSAAELEDSLDRLEPACDLWGIDAAVDRLAEAVVEGRRILVVGDFDADGATSCALAVRVLRAMGAVAPGYLVPNRFEFGYGLTPEIVEVAAQRGPDLLVTVDNGVSSLAGVDAARRRGMQVVITDHHLPGETLPRAEAIVNPNQPGDGFASKHLAGVGVIFYVMLALRTRLREAGWFAGAGPREPNMARHLDLVALGTVADVVVLDRNNRILVGQGLRRIRAGQCCAGIAMLLEAAGRNRERTTAADLGFGVAPRLNAAGRLDDMSLGIECLLSDDPEAARAMAAKLDRLNRERREIETRMREEAMAAIDCLHLDREAPSLPVGLCLYDEGWHQGVIGILAARVRERLHRPVIAFAPAGAGELKGSARSVPGVHIRDVLDAVAALHPGLIARFGGHAMAAGLSLPVAHLEPFRSAFDAQVRRHVSEDELYGVVHSDGELAEQELGLELAELLRAAGPWGQGFPEPVFDGRFEVLQRRVVGERHLKLVLRPLGGDSRLDAIAFGALDEDWPLDAPRVSLAYRLDVNEYRGARGAQLIVEHMEGC